MSAPDAQAASLRRDELCAQLQAQREVIARKLHIDSATGESFPRSATLRLVTRRPELIARALGLVFSLFRSR
jgi:hypothetical protein